MTWPKDRYITCTGFSKELLPALRQALDGRMVIWGRSSGFAGAFSTEFTFAGCSWVLNEMNEYVEGFRLVSGNPTPEDLTVALLTGKIEVS
jgi:hypothetical protein